MNTKDSYSPAKNGLILGIDASRNRSGGARAHLLGILAKGDPEASGIREVHVWAYQALLDALPSRLWIVKHAPPELNKGLLRQVLWQRFCFRKELQEAGCSIVLNTDAGTVSTFRPAVTMSRDMLSYEPGEIERFGLSRARMRLVLLRWMQNRSLRDCDAAIFLTHHAANVIQDHCGELNRIGFIPHGVGVEFKQAKRLLQWPETGERRIKCLYISPIWEFKHQWVVVRAIAALRASGVDMSLRLIGGGNAHSNTLLERQLRISDPGGEFVEIVGRLDQDKLPLELANADLFVFASSCENMPNTLLEAMSVGLPIACSNRGPMPEILKDGGVYFDPEDDTSIESAISELVNDSALREEYARRANRYAQEYSWSRCARETFDFVAGTHRRIEGPTSDTK